MVRSPTSLEENKNQQPGRSFMHLSSCFIWLSSWDEPHLLGPTKIRFTSSAEGAGLQMETNFTNSH